MFALRSMRYAAPGLRMASSAVGQRAGVAVATSDLDASLSSLSMVVRGGSRSEPLDQPGVSHVLKNFGFKNTTEATGFRVTRETELLGGSLSATLGREAIVYSAQFNKKDLDYFVSTMASIAQGTRFQEHENTDILADTERETLNRPAHAVVFDALHKIAFRKGLGNPLYMPPGHSVSRDQVSDFADSQFVASNISLVGVGVDQDQLEAAVDAHFTSLPQASQSPRARPTKYIGGDVLIDSANEENQFVLAYPGPARTSSSYAAAKVLSHLLGGEPKVKYGTGSSPLAKAAAEHGVRIAAFAHGYSDAGLIGVHAVGEASRIPAAIQAARAALTAAASTIDTEEFTRAKTQAKFEAIADLESKDGIVEDFATRGAFTNKAELSAAYDAVTTGDVIALADKLVNSVPSTVAMGNTRILCSAQ